MGIQVNEPLTLPNGITIPSYYMCIKSEVRSTKISLYNPETDTHTDGYLLSATFLIFVDDTKSNVEVTSKQVHMRQEQPPTDIYASLYNNVKEGLTNFVDVL